MTVNADTTTSQSGPALLRRSRVARVVVSTAALFAVIGLLTPLSAETLNEALLAAYQTNPRLDAERARMRATDEDVPRAKAGFRPSANASADTGIQSSTTRPAALGDGTSHGSGYQVNLRQSVFSGFRTVNGVREAEAGVRAGRENLRTVESQILLEAVTAYADVIRDTALVRLRETSLAILTREYQAAQARREVREVTKTDVAQTQLRRARAMSALDLARANLKTSRAVYERVIGRPPHNLSEPKYPEKLIPINVEDAMKIAEKEAPNVVSALYREQARTPWRRQDLGRIAARSHRRSQLWPAL